MGYNKKAQHITIVQKRTKGREEANFSGFSKLMKNIKMCI